MTLDVAARWHTQPWKVAGGTKTLWYARTEAIRTYEIRRQNKRKQDAENRIAELEQRRR